MSLWIAIILALIFGSAAIAGVSAAPWVPTKPKQRRHLINALELNEHATCIDLGCGDGTVLFAVARKFPNVKAIGYDISLLPFCIAQMRKLFHLKKYKRVSIRFGNLFKQDVSKADVVFVFLLEKSYGRLKAKFAKELSDSSVVVVEAWPFAGIEPTKTIKEEGLLPVYFYRGSSFRK